MSKPPKIDRKSLKGPDEFQKKGAELLSKIPLEKLPIVPIAAIFILGFGSYFGYQWWSKSQEEKAWTELYQAEKLPEEKRWDAMEKFIGTAGNSRAAFVGTLMLADYYFEKANDVAIKPTDLENFSKKAFELYSKAAEFSSVLPSEKQLALIQKAASLEQTSQWDEARKTYEAALQVSGGMARPVIYLGLGRVYEQLKDNTKSQEWYRKVVSEFDKTPYANTAKGHLRRMTSPIFNENQAS